MHVSLEPYKPNHWDVFRGWCTVPAAFDFLRKSAPSSSSPAELFEYFVAVTHHVAPDRRAWAIVDGKSGALVGHLEAKATPRTRPAEGELIYFVGTQHRRRGLASAAVGRLAGSPALVPAFGSLVAFCRPTNDTSIAVLRRAHFALAQERSSDDALCFLHTFAAL